MFRQLAHIVSRTARPATALTIGTAGGRFVYLTAAVGHAAIAVPLDRADVEHLAGVLTGWLAERAAEESPYRRRRYDQCRGDCTTDCGACKGLGPPPAFGTERAAV